MEEALALASIFFFFGVIIYVMIWFYRVQFKEKIKYKVCVDNGMSLRCYSATPIDTKIDKKSGEQFIILKTKAFTHDVVVPKNSFRITHSKLWGSYITFLVDGTGAPKTWSNDVVKGLDTNTYINLKKYDIMAKTLGFIRWLPLIKLMVIAIIVIILVFAILYGYTVSQMHPTVIVKLPHPVNQTLTNVTRTTTTPVVPPPPG